MTSGALVRLVAAREIVQVVRSTAFRVATLLMTTIVLAGAILPGLLREHAEHAAPAQYRLGVVDERDVLVRAGATADRIVSNGATVVVTTFPTVGVARAMQVAGRLDAVLAGDQLFTPSDPPAPVSDVAYELQRELRQIERAAELGLPVESARDVAVTTGVLRQVRLDPPAPAQEAGLAYIALLLLFSSLSIFGGATLQAVLQEKSSRVVEVVLSTITPRQLLTGKLLGVGGVGLAQTALLAAVGAIAGSLAGTVELPRTTIATAIGTVVAFVLGFLLYSALFAMAGAVVSRQEDAQAAATPVSLVLMGSYLAAVFTVVGNPDGAAAHVLTFVPLTAPMATIARLATGHPPLWELLAGALVLVAAIRVVLRLAARVYQGAALRFGPRLSLRAAFRLGASG